MARTDRSRSVQGGPTPVLGSSLLCRWRVIAHPCPWTVHLHEWLRTANGSSLLRNSNETSQYHRRGVALLDTLWQSNQPFISRCNTSRSHVWGEGRSSYLASTYSSCCCQRAPSPSMTASIKPRTLSSSLCSLSCWAVMCACPAAASFSLPRSCRTGAPFPCTQLFTPSCLCPIRPLRGREGGERAVGTKCQDCMYGGGNWWRRPICDNT